MVPTLFKKVCSLRENLFRLQFGQEKIVALGYPGAKTSLKENDVPTLFPVVEAMLMSPIRRISKTTVHLGSKRTVNELSVRIHLVFTPQLW